MALVKVSGQSWGTLWDLFGNVKVGQAASINTTVYQADGVTALPGMPGAFFTDISGALPGYVFEGPWTLTVGASTFPAEAVSGTLRSDLNLVGSNSALALGRATDPTDVGYDVILVGGQSNMSGRGTADQRIDAPDARVWQYGLTESFGAPGAHTGTHALKISQAIDPLYSSDGPVGLGHALQFAREYARMVPSNRKVLLIPCGHGGTDMNTHWFAGTPGGTLYELAIGYVQAALAIVGEHARLVGILWLQGEAEIAGTGAAYQPKLDAMIDGFRSRLGIADLPFVLGMIPDFISPANNRDQIHAVHVDTPRRKTRTGFYYGPVDPTGATYMNTADGAHVHYNELGQRVLGAAAPRAWRVALANVLSVAPVPPESLTAVQSGTSLLLSWMPPIGRATDYLVEYKLSSAPTWTTLSRAANLIEKSATITGLTKGVNYDVRVSTINEQGTSTPALLTAFAMLSNPAQVTGVAAGTATQTTQPLTWTTTPTASSYLLEYKRAVDSTWLPGPTVTTNAGTVTGLAPETSYDYRVSAINAGGTGTASATTTASTLALATILDDVPVAAYAAWSVSRRVKGGYSGPLIRVRRSSDDTEQDVGLISPGVLDEAALLTFAGAGNAFIRTIYDQSGNGRDVSQTTNSAQPRIVLAGVVDKINTHPGFVGTSATGLSRAAVGLYAAGAATITVIAQISSAGTIVGEMKSTGAIPYYWPLNAANVGDSLYRAIRGDGGAYNLAEANAAVSKALHPSLSQIEAIDTGTNLTTRVDRTQLDNLAYNRTNALTPDNICVMCAVRNTFLGVAGNFCEAIAWASALNTTNRDTAAANQKAFYGTA